MEREKRSGRRGTEAIAQVVPGGTALSIIDPQPNGYPRSIADPLGRQTTFEYNGSGIVRVVLPHQDDSR